MHERHRQPVEDELDREVVVRRSPTQSPSSIGDVPRRPCSSIEHEDAAARQQAERRSPTCTPADRRALATAAGPAATATPRTASSSDRRGDDDQAQQRHRSESDRTCHVHASSVRSRSPRTPGGRASRDTSRPTTPRAAAASACGWYGVERRRRGTPGSPANRGSSTASCTQPLRTSRPMPGLRSMMPQHHLRRRLDDEQQPHRLVDLDHLPRQAGPQVAGRAVHHAQQRR